MTSLLTTIAVTIFVGTISTYVALQLLNWLAPKLGLIDYPTTRKLHGKPTPTTGGLAIASGLIATLMVGQIGLNPALNWMLCGALLILIVGVFDDRYNLPAIVRLTAQITIATLVCVQGDIQIVSLGSVPILGDLVLGPVAPYVTVFAIVTAVNAMNFIDGIDGLAITLALTSLAALAVIAFAGQKYEIALLLTALIVCSSVFMSKNIQLSKRPRAEAFLGDAGSTTLGFIIACCLVYMSQGRASTIEPTTALWLFTIPLVDIFTVVCKRLARGQSPFKPSRDHLHHLLLNHFHSTRQVTVMMTLLAMTGVGIGWIFTLFDSALPSMIAFCLALGTNLAVSAKLSASNGYEGINPVILTTIISDNMPDYEVQAKDSARLRV